MVGVILKNVLNCLCGVQIDNEFGSYGHEDAEYLEQLIGLIRKHGIKELLLTADRAEHLSEGSVAGALATVTARGTPDDVASALKSLRSFQPKQPLLVTLLDANGTTRWGEPSLGHQHTAAAVTHFRRSVNLILRSNASINVYAFVGGTNFGLWSGAVEDAGNEWTVQQGAGGIDNWSVNMVRKIVHRRGKHRHGKLKRHRDVARSLAEAGQSVTMETTNNNSSSSSSQDAQSTSLVYRPAVTSYNYGSPPIISQSGHNQFSLKYHAFRRLLLERGVISRLQAVPTNALASNIGHVRMEQQLDWEHLLALMPNAPITLESPVFMESLNTQLGSGQTHGWIVYRTRLPPNANELNVTGTMRDRMQLFVDGIHRHTLFNKRLNTCSVSLTLQHIKTAAESTLEMVVENMGRSSFGLLDDQRKGFEGQVLVDAQTLDSHWEHFSIDFSSEFVTAAKRSKLWVPVRRPFTPDQAGRPTMYRGHFKVRLLRDTYVDMYRWNKGVVVINGFVLGRYWNIGPQQSLYVPSPILNHGLNEVVVFELERTAVAHVKFVAKYSLEHHRHKAL